MELHPIFQKQDFKMAMGGLTALVLLNFIFALFGINLIPNFQIFTLVQGVILLIGIALLVGYMYHIALSKTLGSTKKILWALAVLFLGTITQPVYFYLHIWKTPGVTKSKSRSFRKSKKKTSSKYY